MAFISAGDLRNRVELLRRTEVESPLGEVSYTYEPERKFWAQIVPISGTHENVAGAAEHVTVTHRVIARRSALPVLSADMRLRYRGQDYSVVYFYPNYKDGGFVDVFCRLVVDDGIKSF